MNWDNASGIPMSAAFIVALAIIALGGISFAFQGHVHF